MACAWCRRRSPSGGMPDVSTIDPTAIRGLLERVRAVHIGVDLGQAQDFSAIAVVEVGERPTQRMQRDWRRPGRSVPEMESTYRSEEHTSELQSHSDLVCRLLLEK